MHLLHAHPVGPGHGQTALGFGSHLAPVSLSQFPHLSLVLPSAIEGVPMWVYLGSLQEHALAASLWVCPSNPMLCLGYP